MKELLNISGTSLRIYCILQATMEVFKLMLQYYEPAPFTYLSMADKIATIITALLFFQLTPKLKHPAIIYFCMITLCFAFFEYYYYTRPAYVAYLTFTFIFSFAHVLSVVSGFKLRTIVIIHIITYIYHLARLVYLAKCDENFPSYIGFYMCLNFIVFDIPSLYTLKNFANFTATQEKLINDFKHVINFLPYPLIIYDSQRVILSNQAANASFVNNELHTLIQESNILSNTHTPSFAYKCRIYSLKSIKLNTYAFGNSSYLISIVDNTEIIKAEKAIASENAKWLFINSTCHQLRTPLSGIECSISMLNKCLFDEDKGKIQHYVSICLVSAAHLRHIVDDSIYLCEDTNSTIATHNNSFSFDELISEIRAIFKYESESKKIIFNLEDRSYPFTIYSDKKLIMHAVSTLLMNAFKYTTNGQVILKQSIEPISESKAKLVVIVEDTGIGMKEDKKSELFTLFTNPDSKKEEQATSNGIALYVVKKIASSLKGGITFSSILGKGSKFTLWVMIDIASSKNVKAKMIPNTPIAREKEILIVDDNSVNIYVLNSMLKKLNVNCDKAYNGAEAVSMYENKCYGLIFMDINMPVMNGYEASMIIKKKSRICSKDVVIIAYSAQNEPLSEDVKKYGFDKWIEKPIHFDRLSKIIIGFNNGSIICDY